MATLYVTGSTRHAYTSTLIPTSMAHSSVAAQVAAAIMANPHFAERVKRFATDPTIKNAYGFGDEVDDVQVLEQVVAVAVGHAPALNVDFYAGVPDTPQMAVLTDFLQANALQGPFNLSHSALHYQRAVAGMR